MVHWRVFALIGLTLLAVVGYLPTLQAGFVWDDISILVEAEPVREISGLWHIWFEPTALDREAHYWPITYSSFWLEHKLWGFAPAGYHATNIVLHLLNSLLFLMLLRRFALPGAWLAAAIFAVHPVHVEPVAWVMGRKDLLATLFTLTSFLVWLRFVETACAGRPLWRLWVCALLLYVAALFSKSIAITLPVAFLLWHWWRQGRVHWHDVLRLLPFLLVGLIYAVADTVYYVSSMGPLSFGYSLPERLLIACRALVFYVTKLIWPTELAVIYPIWDVNVGDPLGWLYVAVVVTVLGVLWCLRARLGRGPLAAVLFFIVTLSPVLCFVDYGYMQFSLVADRYQYLASASMMALFAFGVHRFCDGLRGIRLRVVRAGLAVLLLVMVALTWRQARVYHDMISLFSHVVALNPEARDAHANLALGLMIEERYEEALVMSLAAIERWPEGPYMYHNAGESLNALGRPQEAEAVLREGVRHRPKDWYTLFHLAESLRLQARYAEAVPYYRAGIQQDEREENLYIGLGASLLELARPAEARAMLERALHLNMQPQVRAGIHRLLGDALARLEQHEAAARHLQQVLHLQPGNKEVLASLANLRLVQGRYEAALSLLQRLAELEPGNASVCAGLGSALLRLGRYEQARGWLERGLSLGPSSELEAHLHSLLGETLRQSGQSAAADEAPARMLEAEEASMEVEGSSVSP